MKYRVGNNLCKYIYILFEILFLPALRVCSIYIRQIDKAKISLTRIEATFHAISQ